MKVFQTEKKRGEFALLAATRHAQAAMMTLPPGGSSDDQLSNEHPRCEQWLLVCEGRGTANISPRSGKRRSVPLRTGVLLVIEQNELHQIKNSGSTPLRTFNLYVPPAYRSDGNVRPTAKAKK